MLITLGSSGTGFTSITWTQKFDIYVVLTVINKRRSLQYNKKV